MALTIAPEEIINHRFRRGASGERTNLDNEAAAARALGMSYGEHKGRQREGTLPANALAALEEAEGIPDRLPEYTTRVDGTRRYYKKDYPEKPCAHCGKVYKPRCNTSKYCCDACSRAAGYIRAQKRGREYRERQAAKQEGEA